jgi:hypothetical protein
MSHQFDQMKYNKNYSNYSVKTKFVFHNFTLSVIAIYKYLFIPNEKIKLNKNNCFLQYTVYDDNYFNFIELASF